MTLMNNRADEITQIQIFIFLCAPFRGYLITVIVACCAANQ